MSFGLDLDLDFGSAGGGASIDFYADSAGGDDGNDGTTEATAFQTLGALETAVTARGNNTRVSLARGSTWREQFDVTVNGLVIGVHGSGDFPVLDGADVITGTWTQPDAGTYPNVWQISWTRDTATTSSSEMLGYWQAGVRTSYHTTLANLQAGSNGDWSASSLTTKSTTIYVRSAADPTSDGITREATRRHYGINGHAQITGSSRTGFSLTGPIEIKRCVGHYNAFTGPKDGSARKLFLRDGNIHHSVTETRLTEDVVATEFSPQVSPSVFTAYRSDGSVFDHTFRRCFALLATRPLGGSSAFYGHGSTGDAALRSMALEGVAAVNVACGSAAAQTLTINGAYCVDPYEVAFGATAAENVFNHLLAQDTTTFTTAGSRSMVRRLTNATFTPTLEMNHACIFARNGGPPVQIGNTYSAAISNSSIVVPGKNPIAGVSGDRPTPNIQYSVVHGARSYNEFASGYVGDFNVFYFVTQPAPQFHWNGTVYGTLALFQAASGQDANSVFLKDADQVSGNGIAFWLGFASGTNAGPADGDFRINPSAKVYAGDGTALTGLFADGVTPITAAGAQEHYDFNSRSVVAGPPESRPSMPTTLADMRDLVEGNWTF